MKFFEFLNNFKYVNNGVGINTNIKDLDKAELLVGLAVEREHSKNLNHVGSIAVDHLTEKEKYYTELLESGLVDEEIAILLAKKYLGYNPNKVKVETNIEDEPNDPLADKLLGYKPKNVGEI